MELFEKMVNGSLSFTLCRLTVFAKNPILDAWQGYEYVFAYGVDNKKSKSGKLAVNKHNKIKSNQQK